MLEVGEARDGKGVEGAIVASIAASISSYPMNQASGPHHGINCPKYFDYQLKIFVFY